MRKLKVGDIVEVLDGHKGSIWVSPMRNYIGKKYRITDFRDHEPNNRIVRIDGSCWNFEEKYLRLVDKYTEVKEDKEVKNPEKIEVGDLVEVLDGKEGEVWASGMNQYIGDTGVVDRDVGVCVRIEGIPYYFEKKYVRLVKKGKTAPLAEEKKEEKQEDFNVGDFVLILDGRDEGTKEPGWVDEMDNLIGQIGVVCRKNCDNAIRVKACGEDWNYATNWIRKIDPKEYFQEGDKVVILNGKNDPVNYSVFGVTADHWVDGMDQTIGQIGTIKTLNSGCCNVRLPNGDYWWYNYPWVRKATEEEIAAAGTAAAKDTKEESEDNDVEDEDKADTKSFIDIIKEELGAKSDKEPAPSTETSDSEDPLNDTILEMVDVMACSSLNTKNIIDTLEKALTVFRKETPDSKEYRDAMHSIFTIGKAYSIALETANKFAQSVSEITDRILKSISED